MLPPPKRGIFATVLVDAGGWEETSPRAGSDYRSIWYNKAPRLARGKSRGAATQKVLNIYTLAHMTSTPDRLNLHCLTESRDSGSTDRGGGVMTRQRSIIQKERRARPPSSVVRTKQRSKTHKPSVSGQRGASYSSLSDEQTVTRESNTRGLSFAMR